MLRLNLNREARWLDLGHGVRLNVEPLSTTTMVGARRDPIVADLPDDATNDVIGLAMARSVARRVVVDWEGVGDEDGRPVPVSPEGLDALLEVWPIFDAFQTKYLAGAVLLDQEKNGSAPSPSGTS